MAKFKTTFTCDVCGKEITYPKFRIEWGYNKLPESHKAEPFEFIQVCHEDCSYGIKNGKNHPITIGDIIFDQLPYSAEDTKQRLKDLKKDNPLLKDKIKSIKNKLFE